MLADYSLERVSLMHQVMALAFGQNDISVNPSVMMNDLVTMFVTPGGKWGMNTHYVTSANGKWNIIFI